MLEQQRLVQLPGSARNVFKRLQAHIANLNQGLITHQLRQYSFTNRFDKIKWKDSTLDSLIGTMGSGEGPTVRGGKIEVRYRDANTLILRFSVPDWVKPIFVIFMLISLLPPLWVCFGLGLLTYFGATYVAIPRLLNGLEQDIRHIAHA